MANENLISSARLAFQLSPIIFVDGIASKEPNRRMSILQVTEPSSVVSAKQLQDSGLISGIGGAAGYNQNILPASLNQELLKYPFAEFQNVSGGTLQDNTSANYPFANMRTAANSVIGQPLAVSLKMIISANKQNPIATQTARMMALQKAFETHNFSGGSYIVLTPKFVYFGCLMGTLTDASSGTEITEVQSEWIITFKQPLIALEDAAANYNALMQRIADGRELSAAPSHSGNV